MEALPLYWKHLFECLFEALDDKGIGPIKNSVTAGPQLFGYVTSESALLTVYVTPTAVTV